MQDVRCESAAADVLCAPCHIVLRSRLTGSSGSNSSSMAKVATLARPTPSRITDTPYCDSGGHESCVSKDGDVACCEDRGHEL